MLPMTTDMALSIALWNYLEEYNDRRENVEELHADLMTHIEEKTVDLIADDGGSE